MNKRITVILIVVAAFALGIAVGQRTARRNVITYSVPVPNGKIRNAVHMDWPTYGLPMAEYRACLLCLDLGQTNKLRERLDTFMDMALFDASFRRPALPDDKRSQVDTAIAAVARYRIDHPSTTMPQQEGSNDQWHDVHPHFRRMSRTVSNLLTEVGTRETDTQQSPRE